jgi:hypothetical protein
MRALALGLAMKLNVAMRQTLIQLTRTRHLRLTPRMTLRFRLPLIPPQRLAAPPASVGKPHVMSPHSS